MIAHKYNTQQEALDAIAELDQARGFNGATQTSAIPFEQEGFWYFSADDKHKEYYETLQSFIPDSIDEEGNPISEPSKPIYLQTTGTDGEGNLIKEPFNIDITDSLTEIEKMYSHE